MAALITSPGMQPCIPAPKTDTFQLAFESFKAAHKSILNLDRKKLCPAKTAGDALIQMRKRNGCTVAQLLHTLDAMGVKISEDTHNRYVKVASRWDELVGIAKERNIDLEKLGYMEALDLLPPSEHAQRVKAGKQKKKLATDSATEASEILKTHGDTLTEDRNRDHRNQQDIWERETMRAEAEAEALKRGMSQKPQKPVAPCQNSLETLDDIDRSLASVIIHGPSLKAPQRIALARTLNAIIHNAQKLLDTLNGNTAETKNLTLTGDER